MRYLVLLSLFTLSFSSFSAQNWQLVWSDEFNGNSLDTTKWTHDRGTGYPYGLNGWGNGELQYYQEDNATVANGVLTIEAREEPQGISDFYSGDQPYYYSSSKILTREKYEFLFGKVEARIKTIDGQGYWPAFWMLPGGCWPETGEIDIMEQWGNDGNTSVTTGAAHLGNCGGGSTYQAGSNNIGTGSYADGYHTYSVIWVEDYIGWYVDGQLFHSVTPSSYPAQLSWPFNSNDWFIILNLAITSGGPSPNTAFPGEINVDYVRVYQYDTTIQPQVTFRVDMSQESLAPTDIVYLNGNFNGWCGPCEPMDDMGNGIWAKTIALDPGQIEYKFTTNGWDGLIEEFEPETECCITIYDGPNVFVNRVASISVEDVILDQVCFNSCATCLPSQSGCTDPTATNYDPAAAVDDGSCAYDITFLVDMNNYGGEFSNPELNGTFNGWCGDCEQMNDLDDDGIYEVDVVLTNGFYEFKFSIDNWTDQEMFIGGEDCTLTTGQFVNRTIQVNGAGTYGPVCWGSCFACPNDCEVFDSPPVDLTKSFDPVAGVMDRVQLKWFKASPEIRYSDEDAAACDIKFWAKRNLDPLTGNPVGPAISEPDTVLILDAKKSYGNGSPKEIFKWPVKFRADAVNNTKRADPNIRYEWQVRCACEHGLGIESPWSDVKTFNTPDFNPTTGIYTPAGAVEPNMIKSSGRSDEIDLFPNPIVDGTVNMKLPIEHAEQIQIQVISLIGERIHESYHQTKGQWLQIDLGTDLESGMYIIQVLTRRGNFTRRIILE